MNGLDRDGFVRVRGVGAHGGSSRAGGLGGAIYQIRSDWEERATD